MKRKTLVLFGTFVGLLVVVAVVKLWPQRSAGPDLRLAGWGSGEKVEKAEEEGPVDKIVIEAEGTKTTLRREKKDKWLMEPPAGARADKWKVRQIVEAFRDGLSSVVSSRVSPDTLAAFGLDEKSAIKLTLYRGESVFAAVEIGSVQKPEDGVGEGDTFVREPGSDRVYRIIGKDLRRPFEAGIKGLRDKRVNDFESDDVVEITLKNPRAQAELDKLIVLKSEPKVQPQGEAEAEEKKEKKEREWRFEKPQGIKAGNIKSFAATIASLYAQEYVDSLPEGVAIGDDAVEIEVVLEDGRRVKMRVSEVKDESAYVAIEGVPGYAKVSKYTAESLAKKVSDLRDKAIFGVKKEDIVRVSISDGGSRVEVVRQGEGWRAAEPAGLPVGKAQMDMLVRDIETLQAKDILDPAQVTEDTGLSSAKTIVSVTTRDGKVLTLRIGREIEKEKGTFYAGLSGSREILTIASWMAQRVKKGPKDLRNKTIFDFTADRIKTIEIVRADETLKLERKEGDKFRATAPQVVEDLKEDTVRTLVNTLAGLTAKEIVEGKKRENVGLAGKAKVEVAVVLEDGSRHVLRISEQNQSGDPFAEAPTEPDMKGAVFTLNQYQVRNFDKRLEELR